MINSWNLYRDFRFDSDQAGLRSSEAKKISEIARYLKANPSLKVGIDGSMVPANQDLSDQRVHNVREALLGAGVPASKIQTGTFGETKRPHDGRVAVLIRTANY